MPRPQLRVELGALDRRRDGSGTVVSTTVRIGDDTRRLWLRTTASETSDLLDPFVALTIVPAMKLGGGLVIRGPVSGDLLTGLDRVQRLWQIWRRDPYQHDYPYAWRIPIEAEEVAAAPPAGTGRATFFSAGVDSFHTLLAARDDLDHLLFIDEFEMASTAASSDALFANAQRVADELGLTLIRIGGNYKDLFLPYVSWRMYGGLLPGLSMLHAPAIGHALISSNEDLGNMAPWSTHPEQEPLFSTASQSIAIESGWLTRLDKIGDLVDWPFAMEHLRVCWTTAENCGRCNKCVRTLLAFMALDRTDAAVAFPRSWVAPAEVTNAMRTGPNSRTYFEEIAYHLIDEDRLPDYIAAIDAGMSDEPVQITRAHALSVLAPEPVRRAVRRVRGAGTRVRPRE